MVYKAWDLKLKRTVALKLLAPGLAGEPEVRARFIKEAQAASAIDHTNICTIHEIERDRHGKWFIAMAYYEGELLKEKIKRGPLKLEEVIDITLQVAQGLAKAHEQGIIHRDIKPANIIITTDGKAKILDFGVAKLAGQTRLTKIGVAPGTVAYMSPEQAAGEEVDPSTDIWSLGVVLYEMVTGQLPFKGGSEQVGSYSIQKSGFPESLQKIMDKALKKDKNFRYKSSAELVADLEKVKESMESGEQILPKPKKLDRYGKWSFRIFLHKISFPLGGTVIMLLILLLLPWSRDFVKRFLGMRTFALAENLVILPFTNAGSDPNNQALCDGLGETVNRKLSQLEKWEASLRVVPVSDVRYYNVYGAEEARKIFGATLAVSGNVERMGNGVRLTLELVDTKSKRLKPLRSAVAYYTMANAAALPDWTVRKMAEMLKIELSPQALQELAKGGSSNSSASLFYLRVRGHLQRSGNAGNLDMAIALFERALGEDPLYALAYAGLGEAYWRRYQIAKESRWKQLAVDNCFRAVQLDEQLVSAHLNLGVIYAGGGRYPNAIGEFQKALILDSLNVEAYRGLANAYQNSGQNSQAESTYLKAIKARPNYPAGYSHLGAFYRREGRYEDAATQFERVVEFAPENYRAYNNLGALYLDLDRPADAEGMFKRSLEIQPDYSAAYSNLGSLYFFEVARYAEAARTYEKARNVDSSDYRVWGNLASAYYWAPGETAKAHAAYLRAARMAEERRKANPQDAALLSHLANYYAMLGNRGRAFPLLEQSLALAPGDPDVMARAGGTYEQLGQREKALEWIGEALKKGFSLKNLTQWPGLNNLRKDARFLRLAEAAANKSQN